MKKLSIRSQILAVEDEITDREKSYSRAVRAGRMRQEEMDYKICAMRSVRSTLEFCRQHEAAIREYIAQKNDATGGA